MVYAYAVSRFDRRFHVPNGSSAPGHYSGSRVMESAATCRYSSDRPLVHYPSFSTLPIIHSLEINREADVFGDDGRLDSPTLQRRRQSEWERGALEELSRVFLAEV